MDADKLKRLVALKQEKDALKADLDAVNAKYDQLAEELAEGFAGSGIKSVKMDGHTVFLHEQLWANAAEGADKAEAVKALQAVGLDDCVQVGTQRLSSFVRELGKDKFFEQYPSLSGRIGAADRIQVKVRRS